ncbi:hypothetical protein TNCV_3977551 [Trichonephila clavipes]|nr:hypothetical protein TNCV_3977551 [Trichonephila clavipes]
MYALILELIERKAMVAEKLYCEMYPQIDTPVCQMFAKLYHNLCSYGSLRGNWYSKDRTRIPRTPNRYLDYFERYPTHFVPYVQQNVLDTVARWISWLALTMPNFS